MTETRHARTAPIYGNMLEMIGNTPMLEVTRMDTGPCRLFVKMESMNPGNSIKDRIAVSMIEAAESKGLLKPGGLIVEATAGNTGLALALVGSQKGYTVVVVVPDKMSHEKISHLKAVGAESPSRSDVTKEHPDYYQNVAPTGGEPAGGVLHQPVRQRGESRGPLHHHGPEIWAQLEGKVDAFVAGSVPAGPSAGSAATSRNRTTRSRSSSRIRPVRSSSRW